MDIGAIHEVTKDVPILFQGKETGLVFVVNALRSESTRKAIREMNDEKLAKGEVDDDRGLNVIMACVTGWRWDGEVTFKGEKPDFNAKNLKTVLTSPWGKASIVDQIMDAVRETDDFFTA